MLLKALYDFAHSRPLLDDLAFASKEIRWVIQLDAEGNLLGLVDTSDDGKRAKSYPGVPKVSGAKNAGGVAEFLVERLTALFGKETEPEKYDGDEKKRLARLDNNHAKYQNFWHQIENAYKDTQSPALWALLKFHQAVGDSPPFLRWGVKNEADTKEKPTWRVKTAKGEETKYQADSFGFLIDGNLVWEEAVVRDWWRKLCEQASNQKEEKAEKGVCLITGQENVPIARTHDPKIELPDTPPGGAALVSFEKSSPAFSSYGNAQSYNAPTSIYAAKAYCEALNYLIKNKKHHIRIADTTICFWARDNEEATDVIAGLFDKPNPEVVRDFFASVRTGSKKTVAEQDVFYSVTLGSNSGRVVVRNWLQIPLETAMVNLSNWFADLDIVPFGSPKFDEANSPLRLKNLALTTVRDEKRLRAEVIIQLYQAALDGTAPSLAFLSRILARLTIDLGTRDPRNPWFSQSRFSLLRLIVNRSLRKEGKPEMEPRIFETIDTAYNCGRLLAVFDSLQRSAHGKGFKGATLAERYFGAASTTPNGAFSTLWRLHQHHLKKLRQQGESGQKAAAKIKETIIQIMALIRPQQPDAVPQFPPFFSLIEQGQFALGFYHQMAVRQAAIEQYLKKKAVGQLQPEEIDEAIELTENE